MLAVTGGIVCDRVKRLICHQGDDCKVGRTLWCRHLDRLRDSIGVSHLKNLITQLDSGVNDAIAFLVGFEAYFAAVLSYHQEVWVMIPMADTVETKDYCSNIVLQYMANKRKIRVVCRYVLTGDRYLSIWLDQSYVLLCFVLLFSVSSCGFTYFIYLYSWVLLHCLWGDHMIASTPL